MRTTRLRQTKFTGRVRFRFPWVLAGMTFLAIATGGGESGFAQRTAGDGPPLHYDAEGNLQSPEMKERQEIREELLELAHSRNFGALEARFTEARESKAIMADGLQLLDFYYRVTPSLIRGLPGFNETDVLGFFQEWQTAFPESPTPLTLRGDLEIILAWESRGGGWASEVTEEGWEGFRRHLGLAETHLTKATELEIQDPQTYARLITVVMGRSGPRELTMELHERGFALDPDFLSLCAAITMQLLPRWGGQPGELVDFAGRTADRLGGQKGDALYARFGRLTYNYSGSYAFAAYHDFDWDRLARGFAALRKEYPQCAAKYFAQEAELAAALGHVEAFRAASSNLGDEWRAHYLGDADPKTVEAKYLALEPQLLEAANLGDLRGLNRLLAEGADINAQNENGQTALNLAVQNDDPVMVDVLIERGADLNIPDSKGWTVLSIATKNDQPHMIRRLVDGGARLDEPRDRTLPLLVAVNLERPETVRLLLEVGADPNLSDASGWTPLSVATYKADPLLIRRLVDGGAHLDKPLDQRAPLLLAIENARPEIVGLLLEFGADPDLNVPQIGTPLLYAIRSIQVDCVSELLDGGADPNLPDAAGWTPLSVAIHKARPDLIETLVRHGARLDEPAGLRAPLMVAIDQSRPELIGLLIDLGANPDLRIPRIGTPMHHAIRQDKVDCVRELLNGGANPAKVILEKNGVQLLPTPLDLAKERGNRELIQLLENVADHSPVKDGAPANP